MTVIGSTESGVDGLDGRAFATLVERHRGDVVAHCRRLLRSPERAEDAAQETLLRAWRSRRSFGDRAPFPAWLRRIATNVCLDEIRRASRGRTGPIPEEADPPAPAASVPDAVLDARQALAEAVHGILGALPPRQRAVLVLRGVLDVPAAGTAAVLGLSTASVNSALQRARAAVRAAPDDVVPGRDDALLVRYVTALASDDVETVVALARADSARPAPTPRRRSTRGVPSFAGVPCRAARTPAR